MLIFFLYAVKLFCYSDPLVANEAAKDRKVQHALDEKIIGFASRIRKELLFYRGVDK
jgi:hypothetical protein